MRQPHPGFYRAVAVDFDGTLAVGGRAPDDGVLGALAESRARGLAVVLVTGRIMKELEEIWPEVADLVDCIVAENGAVLRTSRSQRLLADPIDRRLDEALASHRVPFRRGEVLLAASVADESAILSQVRALQLGCQTVANRSELMVLPAGVSKRSGLARALGHLDLSFHNTVAIGDAENDVALFEIAELAVAVGDAVEPLKAQADLVLAEPDGEGVAAALGGEVLRGARVAHSRRWQIHLGTTSDGRDVSLPASQINVLIAGDTGTGKSYLAGLVAEQLVEDDYSVLVIDPEGDHVGLSRERGTLVLGGTLRVPEPDEVLRLLRHHGSSVVVDLSTLDPGASIDYQRRMLARAEAHRRITGLPHWVFLDEADQLIGRVAAGLPAFDPGMKGRCLVTWRPQDLAVDVVASLDAVVATGPADPDGGLVDLAAAIGEVQRVEVSSLLGAGSGTAVLTQRDAPRQARGFTVARRETPHLRHTHKYTQRPLEHERRFHFRRSASELTGAWAGNLEELEDQVIRCDRSVLRHHCPRHDFSRWVAEVFHDQGLAGLLAQAESSVTETSDVATLERARREMIGALHSKLVY